MKRTSKSEKEVVQEETEIKDEPIEQTEQIEEPTEERSELSNKMSRIAKSLETIHGERSMIYLGDNPEYAMVKRWVSTQNKSLDWIISGRADGTGGLPCGRIIELFGDPSSGKSLMLAHILAATQKLGGIPALIDAEATFDWNFAKSIGLNPKEMLYTKAYRKEKVKKKVIGKTGKVEEVEIEVVVAASVERTTQLLMDLIDITCYEHPGVLLVIGLDSVAVLTTEHELDEPDKKDLTKAGELRKFVRKLEGKISELDIMLICTNHVIANIDANPFIHKVGPREMKSTPGGSGLPFGSSLRLDLKRGKDIKENNVVIGHEIWAFTHKSKIFPARKTTIVDMKFDKGVEPNSGLLDLLVNHSVVEEMGSAIYRYKGERFKRHKMEKYQGFDDIIAKHPEILSTI